MDLKSIKNPSIILHRRYIRELYIFNDKLKSKLDLEPTKSLYLHSYIISRHDSFKGIIEYLKTHSLHKLDATVDICFFAEITDLPDFEDFIEIIFDRLNIRRLI